MFVKVLIFPLLVVTFAWGLLVRLRAARCSSAVCSDMLLVAAYLLTDLQPGPLAGLFWLMICNLDPGMVCYTTWLTEDALYACSCLMQTWVEC